MALTPTENDIKIRSIMENPILKAIYHIKHVSKKKHDPAKIFNYLQNNGASNYTYQCVVKEIQELTIKGVIDKNYKILNPITSASNLPENNIISVSNEADTPITLSPALTTQLATPADKQQPIPILTDTPIESSPTSSAKETPTKEALTTQATTDHQPEGFTYIQLQIDLLKEEIEKSNLEFKNLINKELGIKNIRHRDESDILYEKIVRLEKENSCLKNEIKNQQHIIQMLANDNNTSEWKTIKYRNADDKNRSTKPKTPVPINLNNRFDSLTVRENDNVNANINGDVTPTNLIPNAVPKSRPHLRNANATTKNNNHQSNRRPPVVITESYVNSQRDSPLRTVPGNQSYASTTKYGQKICIIGDSHIRRIKRNIFNNSLVNGRAFLNGFSGANIKRLNHYITPILEEDRPDIVILHIGCNDITHRTIDNIDIKDISNQLIDIGKKCKSYGGKEVIFSSILVKKQVKLTQIIRQVNDYLRDECERNSFCFVNNDNITREYLWKDGTHLNNDGTRIFAGNLVDFLNEFIFNRNI